MQNNKHKVVKQHVLICISYGNSNLFGQHLANNSINIFRIQNTFLCFVNRFESI